MNIFSQNFKLRQKWQTNCDKNKKIWSFVVNLICWWALISNWASIICFSWKSWGLFNMSLFHVLVFYLMVTWLIFSNSSSSKSLLPLTFLIIKKAEIAWRTNLILDNGNKQNLMVGSRTENIPPSYWNKSKRDTTYRLYKPWVKSGVNSIWYKTFLLSSIRFNKLK